MFLGNTDSVYYIITSSVPVNLTVWLTRNINDRKTITGKVNTTSASQRKSHSLSWIDDSHATGCITKVHDDIFRQNIVVSGFVEPGACTRNLASTDDRGVTHLTKKNI